MNLVPLGDAAALACFSDEDAAFRFAEAVRRGNEAWLVDVVQAYAAVAIYFDLNQTSFGTVSEQLRKIDRAGGPRMKGKLHYIPCCYELGPDLGRVAEQTSLSTEDVIRLHAGPEYTVYAIGFCPGFPYLGYLPPELSGLPRLDTPRVRVEPGSVGLTGRQTGIYTEARPGGWNLIGRTPLELVNVAQGYFPLRTGDCVRFQRIDEGEFRHLRGTRI
jgi:inhibitor of KinA